MHIYIYIHIEIAINYITNFEVGGFKYDFDHRPGNCQGVPWKRPEAERLARGTPNSELEELCQHRPCSDWAGFGWSLISTGILI